MTRGDRDYRVKKQSWRGLHCVALQLQIDHQSERIEEMETKEDSVGNNGGKLGMWENIFRNHHNTFKSLFNRNNNNKPDADATADDSANSPKPIPQLSPLANSVVARCSKSLSLSITLSLSFSFSFPLLLLIKSFNQLIHLSYSYFW